VGLERTLSAFWILLGAAAAAYAWTLGLIGSSGPESGLFPLISALIIMGAGIVLLVRPATHTTTPEFPRGAALRRIAGIVVALAVMAVALPHAGFALTGALTMMILLRTTGDTSWLGSIVLALASVALVLWLFGHVLGMALPRGPWGW
jgi:putative tricarboxylic transport membrane protein